MCVIRVPLAHLLRERLVAVLAVVYLIFNEGHGGRDELATDAILLGRALAELLPDEPEVHGLLAMLLIHDSRREGRCVVLSFTGVGVLGRPRSLR